MKRLLIIAAFVLSIGAMAQSTNPTAKGNKVFIECPDNDAQQAEKQFVNNLREWGYWTVVKTKDEADFKIVLNVIPKAMSVKLGWIALQTNDGKTIKESDKFKASPTVFNGYNSYNEMSDKLVNKFLKKEFKS